MRYKSSNKTMKQFIYPAGMQNNTPAFIAPTASPVAPVQNEVAIEAPKQIAPVKLSGKFMLVGKIGRPFNGQVDLKDGIVLLSYNGKVVNTKIANGTFITNDGDQIRFFKSMVTGFKTKSELDAQPVPKSKPARKQTTSTKKQLMELMEENNKLLTMLAANLRQPTV